MVWPLLAFRSRARTRRRTRRSFRKRLAWCSRRSLFVRAPGQEEELDAVLGKGLRCAAAARFPFARTVASSLSCSPAPARRSVPVGCVAPRFAWRCVGVWPTSSARFRRAGAVDLTRRGLMLGSPSRRVVGCHWPAPVAFSYGLFTCKASNTSREPAGRDGAGNLHVVPNLAWVLACPATVYGRGPVPIPQHGAMENRAPALAVSDLRPVLDENAPCPSAKPQGTSKPIVAHGTYGHASTSGSG